MDWRLKYSTAHIHPAAKNKLFDQNLGFVCFLSGVFYGSYVRLLQRVLLDSELLRLEFR